MAKKSGPWGEEIEVAEGGETTTDEGNSSSESTATNTKTDTGKEQAGNTEQASQTDENNQAQPTERIVEVIKEVEKPITFANEASEVFFNKLLAGDEDFVAGYLDEKRRNYDTMSDMDAVKWALRKDHPEWDERGIDLEIKYQYGKSLELVKTEGLFGDDLAAAEKHNEDIEDKIDKLTRDARDARIKLNQQKQQITLPKIERQEQKAPDAPTGPTPEQIADAKKAWEQYAESETPKLSDYKWTIEGEEVSYKFTADEKKALVSEMKAYDAATSFTELGWRDKDGKLFPDKIAKDLNTIRNIDKLIQIAFSQGKTVGKKEAVTKDIKNLNLNPQSDSTTAPTTDAWQQIKQRLYA